MSEGRLYHIIDFTGRREVEVVPTLWVKQTDDLTWSYWPPRGRDATKLARDYARPESSWPTYDARIIRSFCR